MLVQKDSNWGRVQNFKLYLGIEPVNTRVLAISDWLPWGCQKPWGFAQASLTQWDSSIQFEMMSPWNHYKQHLSHYFNTEYLSPHKSRIPPWGRLPALLSFPLFLLKSESEVTQSCPTASEPRDWSLPCSSILGNLQARLLEWVAIPFSRGSSQHRDQTWVSHTADRLFTVWANRGSF